MYRKWVSFSEKIVELRRRESNLDETYWIGKLRHYAHVMDKGLHRGDFSKGHGIRAYGIAKDALSHIKSPEGLGDPSVRWAIEKIRQYEHLQVSEMPSLKSEFIPTSCRYEDLLDVIKTRRSIRRYLNKPVSNEVVDKIADVIDWAPSSCNRQSARIYASNNSSVVRQCVQLHTGAGCFTDIYAPLFMTFCADARLYVMPTELTVPFIDLSLGIQNCLLVAHTLGVSLTVLTCANVEGRRERELRRIFGIPQHFQIIVSVVGGYPDGGVEMPVRKYKELFNRR